MVPVLLGFKPTPEYVEFNILWIACKETKGFFNRRRYRVSSSPCLLPSGLISLHINRANFFQQGKHELAYGEKKKKKKRTNHLPPAFLQPAVRETLWEWWWDILVVPDATAAQRLPC